MSNVIVKNHFFIDAASQIYCLDEIAGTDWQQYIREGWTAISEADAQAILNPPISEEEALANWRATVAEITPKQLRLTLLENGISGAQVENAIAAIEDEITRETAQIEWQYATSYARNNPNLVMIATQLLGLNDEQIDAMWQAALLK